MEIQPSLQSSIIRQDRGDCMISEKSTTKIKNIEVDEEI